MPAIASASARFAGDGLDLAPAVAQSLRGRFQRVGLAGADGQPVALGAQALGEREPDAAAGSGDDGGAVGHERKPSTTRPGPGAAEEGGEGSPPRCRRAAIAPGPDSPDYDMNSV